MPEKWDAYDRFRRKLGYELTRGEAIPDGVMHMVVHMIYYNSRGEILIQKRDENKELAPGVWAFTGGSAVAGEDSRAACIRETVEELGFEPDMTDAQVILSYSRKDNFTDVYLIYTDVGLNELVLQTGEVAEARWVGLVEFERMISEEGVFWNYSYLPIVLKYLKEAEYLR